MHAVKRDGADPTATEGMAAEPTGVEFVLSNGATFRADPPPSPLFAGTISEAETATLYGITPKQQAAHRLAGKGPRAVRYGRTWRYRIADIEADFDASLVRAPAPTRLPTRHRTPLRARA